MITMKLGATCILYGEATEMGLFYASLTNYLKMMEPIVARHISEQEVMNNVFEQLKSLKIQPIGKDEENADKPAATGKDGNVRDVRGPQPGSPDPGPG